jgi:hypothetical protein
MLVKHDCSRTAVIPTASSFVAKGPQVFALCHKSVTLEDAQGEIQIGFDEVNDPQFV